MTKNPAAPTYRDVLQRSIVRHRRTLYWAVPIAIFSQICGVAFPYALGRVIDLAVARQDPQAMLLGCAVLIALLVIGTQAWRLQFVASRCINAIEAHSLRRELTHRIFNGRLTPVVQPAGEILTISSTDAHRAASVVDLLTWSGPSMVALVVSIGLLASINVWLAGIAFVGAVITATVLKLMAPGLIKRHTAQQEAVADTSALAADFVKGLRTIQGIGAQDTAMARYRESSRIARDASVMNAKVSGRNYGASHMMAGILMAAMAGYAAHLTLGGDLTIGVFVTVIGLCQYLIEPLSNLGEQAIMWASAKASAKRVAKVLAGEAAGSESHSEPVQPGRISLRGVTYRTLSDLNLTIAEGTHLAVVSPSPRAAHDLTAVLTATTEPGALRPECAYLGATDLASADMARVRDILLSEPHHVDIFEGTLRDTIALGKPNISDAAIRKALDAAAAGDILDLLPDGLDSVLHDRGANLSGGQRQRIALARAMASEKPVLVLHDPTTAVDSVTEANIAAGVRTLRDRPEFTTIVFTSAPALLEAASEVVFLQGGGVAARGTHHELLQQVPEYERALRR